MLTPALRERLQGHSSCSHCQANRCNEYHNFNTFVKIRNETYRVSFQRETVVNMARYGGIAKVALRYF